MPELPEVEIVKQGLNSLISPPKSILSVQLSGKSLRFPYPERFVQGLNGFSILTLNRRSKYILFQGNQKTLIHHLGMTGSWRQAESLDVEAHDHLLLKIEGGVSLVYRDPRRFGFFDLVKTAEIEGCRWLRHLGPEPLRLGEETFQRVLASMKKSSSPIKIVIMNAKIIVGVGNIYANEALFLAGVKPIHRASDLSMKRLHRILVAIQQVLAAGIANGGSTIRDFKASDGQQGYFQNHFKVYGRDSKPCEVCGARIRSRVLGGRSTYWCPRCQR